MTTKGSISLAVEGFVWTSVGVDETGRVVGFYESDELIEADMMARRDLVSPGAAGAKSHDDSQFGSVFGWFELVGKEFVLPERYDHLCSSFAWANDVARHPMSKLVALGQRPPHSFGRMREAALETKAHATDVADDLSKWVFRVGRQRAFRVVHRRRVRIEVFSEGQGPVGS